jgi:hypothetical protein
MYLTFWGCKKETERRWLFEYVVLFNKQKRKENSFFCKNASALLH